MTIVIQGRKNQARDLDSIVSPICLCFPGQNSFPGPLIYQANIASSRKKLTRSQKNCCLQGGKVIHRYGVLLRKGRQDFILDQNITDTARSGFLLSPRDLPTLKNENWKSMGVMEIKKIQIFLVNLYFKRNFET